MDLHNVPKKAYYNALKLDKKDFVISAEDFEMQVLLEWIKLYQCDLFSDYNENDMIIFNVTDYFIEINFKIIDADTIEILSIDCTDDRFNPNVIEEYFRKNNEHLNFV